VPFPVIQAVSNVLAHVPDLVRYGSKPSREIAREATFADRLAGGLRTFRAAVGYAPHQVFIGNLTPWTLDTMARPWSNHCVALPTVGPFGHIVPQEVFYVWLKLADRFDLVRLTTDFATRPGLPADVPATPLHEVERLVAKEDACPLWVAGQLVGCVRAGHPDDPALSASVILENLAAKASGALAVGQLLENSQMAPDAVDYVLGCGEEAVGDRYQRGGGNLAKAIGELAGCRSAGGADLKAFCCAPVHAMTMAAAAVQAGVFRRVVVVGGGSLAKLGMKSRAHITKGLPVLEDVLGAVAILIGRDGDGPVIRLDAVGRHTVDAGGSPQAILEALVGAPLAALGWRLQDVDRYAVELHNPDITEPAGNGDVPRTNYRALGAFAVLRGELGPEALPEFVARHGMPGFAPTQGHIAASVPFVGHARQLMTLGEVNRVMLVAKGSLFLGRMTQLMDGMSVIIERA
jgi:betaine reductase